MLRPRPFLRHRTTALVAALATMLWGLAPPARAADDGDDDDRKPEKPRTEFTPVPLVGGNTDVGFGGGLLLSLARFEPSYRPYVARVEVASLAMFRERDGKLHADYQDHHLLLRFPDIDSGRLGLELRGNYTREPSSNYYGIGNAARVDPDLPPEYHKYQWIHLGVGVEAKLSLLESVKFALGAIVTHNEIDAARDSKLIDDRSDGPAVVKDLLRPIGTHDVVTFEYGFEWSTRKGDAWPTSGQIQSAKVGLSPGGTSRVPARWGRFHAESRGYVPLGTKRFVLALRGVSDLLFGDPPFYELARQGSNSAFGGPSGVRGVPGQRYYGMVKFLGTGELRAKLVPFHFLGQDDWLAAAAFVDGGRLFATYDSHPELDGTDLGLKMGFGGGPRLIAGKSFVFRSDVAYSPVDSNLGIYLAAGNPF